MENFINCNTGTKAVNRNAIAGFVKKHMTPKRIKNAKICILPGPQNLEYKLWDKIGVLRRNIFAFTNNERHYKEIRKVRGVNCFHADVAKVFNNKDFFSCFRDLTMAQTKSIGRANSIKKAFANTVRGIGVFDIVYWDLYSNFNPRSFFKYASITHAMKSNSLYVLTFSGRREVGESNKYLKQTKEECDVDNNGSRFMSAYEGIIQNALSPPLYLRDYLKFNTPPDFRFIKKTQIDWPYYGYNVFYRSLMKSRDTWKGLGDDAIIGIRSEDGRMFDIRVVEAKSFLKYCEKMYIAIGKYCVDFFKTKYIGAKNAPMLTLGVKFRSCKHLRSNNFRKMMLFAEKKLIKNPVFEISSRNKRQKPKKEKTDKRNIKPITSKTKALSLLKHFPDAADIADISLLTGYTKGQLRAFKAHITMGTYN